MVYLTQVQPAEALHAVIPNGALRSSRGSRAAKTATGCAAAKMRRPWPIPPQFSRAIQVQRGAALHDAPIPEHCLPRPPSRQDGSDTADVAHRAHSEAPEQAGQNQDAPVANRAGGSAPVGCRMPPKKRCSKPPSEERDRHNGNEAMPPHPARTSIAAFLLTAHFFRSATRGSFFRLRVASPIEDGGERISSA